jgi:DNA polymerase I-like protein with 3'-5' exonuclease and polymerase domains
MNIIHGAPMHLPNNTYVAIDTEFQKMNIKKMHRAHGKFALMTMCYEPDTVYYIDSTSEIQPALSFLDNTVWVMHNAKFDITQLRPYANIPPRTKLVDTMLMEKILWSGWYEHFDLQSCVRRYLNEHLDKTLQSAWEEAEVITPEMLEYACKDADATWRVWNEQKKFISKSDMQVYKEVDLPALWAVLDFQGFRVDREQWIELSIKHRQLSDEIDLELPVNPRSPKQVVKYLRENGFNRIKSSAEGDIAEAIKKYPKAPCIPVAQKILDSRGYRKLASTYGASMIEDYAETLEDGSTVVYGDFNIIGAFTGRMCVSGDTVIDTDLGSFEIEDLVLTKDRTYHILTHTGKEQRILNRFYKGKEMMYELQTKSGNHIKCTANHRILTTRGWRFVKDLAIGDMAIAKNNSAEPLTTKWAKSDFGRGDFCRVVDTQKDGSITNIKDIQTSDESDNRHIEDFLRREIQRCYEVRETLSLLNGAERKYQGKEEYANSSCSERSTLTLDKFWKEVVCHCEGDGSERVCNSDEREILRNSTDRRTSLPDAEFGFGILRKVRNVCAWITKLCKRLLQQPTNLLRKIVRSILKSFSNALVYQRSGQRTQLLQRKGESSKVSHLLERKQGRNDVIFGTSRLENISYSTIQLLQEMDSRFLSSFQESSYRGGRRCSYRSESYWTRSEERCKDVGIGIQDFESYSRPSEKECEYDTSIYSRDVITLIVSCGILDVWDIEVEADHSYLAGGFLNHNSCSSPNLQNIPTRETQVFRECFIPMQGNKLVIGDYSQQEIFIMAFLSQDDNMIEICNSGRDIYIEMARLMYKKEIDKKDPLRKKMKSIVLGTDYGMSKFGLSKRLECSVDEAAELINDFFKTFPKVRRWMDGQEKLTKYTQTVLGRRAWLNPYNDKSQRNAYNNPIQGTAADMLKKAVAKIHRELPDPNHPYSQYTVAMVHDEIILDVREVLSKGVANNVKQIMEDVANEMLPHMRCRADVIISDTWRKE